MTSAQRTELQERLGADAIKVTRKRMFGGADYPQPVVRACWSYFYRHGKTSAEFAEQVRQELPGAAVLDDGDHWHAFVGGAEPGSARDSFFYVDFTRDR